MTHNTLETGGLIIATMAVLMVILMAYAIEESSVEGLSQVTREWSMGEGMKVAGSFKMLNRGEDFAVSTPEEHNSIRIKENRYCRVNIAGFRSQQLLRYESLDQCRRTHRPVRTLLRINVQGDSGVHSLEVGGKQP